ncbi:hypothetical protein B566_EDAN012580 [Ephemera danica]|nr:hypothetical protein B566_EDAN012580 [Ephemera danica]
MPQMAWADSWALGCGFVVFNDQGWTRKYYFCNYGPGGNMIGGSMYKVGAGRNCAAYPNLTDSPRWPGLCEVANTNPPGTGCKAEDHITKHTAQVPTYDKNVQIKTVVFPASFFDNRKN